MKYGMTLVSHVEEIAQGLPKLLKQVAGDVSITSAGGTDDGDIGTSMEKILEAFEDNAADEILAFYDLGSSRMNLELAFTTRPLLKVLTRPQHCFRQVLNCRILKNSLRN